MSGNIGDTDVKLVKKQAIGMLKDVKEKLLDESQFKRKYSVLYKTSKGLFDMILHSKNFDEQKLDKMLELVLKIQSGEMSQNKASEEIGYSLAHEYIPQVRNL